jgi:hypothetical protein
MTYPQISRKWGQRCTVPPLCAPGPRPRTPASSAPLAVDMAPWQRERQSVADHLGHKNIQNTRIYAQITHPLREQVFRELEQHPKIVRLS